MSAIAGVNGDVWTSTSPSTPLLPVKDAVSNSSVASASSLTWSHTVGVASNMILVVTVAVGGSGTCSGITYAGASMTQLTSKAQGTETCYIFYKTGPATGANNVVATFSGSVAGIGLAVSYSNVYQTTPFGTAATSSGGSGNSSNTVTVSSTSQLVLDVNFANGSSSAVGAAQTIETSNTAVLPFYFADIASTGASMALSWTNAGSPTIWIEMSVALNPNPEGCTDTGDHIHYFTNTHQAWDQSQGITVQCSPNGTSGWATVSDYVFYWPVGEIVFNSARVVSTNNFVRILQGNYFTLSALDGAHMWKMSAKGQTKDVTTFQASGAWALNLGTIKSMTFSVDCFRYDARILNEMITGMGATNISGGIIMCQLWFDEANGKRWQFYALPTGISNTTVSNDVDKQSVNFQATGPVYVITSNTFSTTAVTQQ